MEKIVAEDIIARAWQQSHWERRERERAAALKAASGRLLNEREQMDCYIYVPRAAFKPRWLLWSVLKEEFRQPLIDRLKEAPMREGWGG